MDFGGLVSQFIKDPPTALLLILILGAVAALGTGRVVPKTIYDREIARGDKLAGTVESMVAAQRDVAEALKDLTAEVLRK